MRMRWAWLTALLAVSAGSATVVPNPLFSDHAVLQRGKPIPVWGHAAPKEAVTVTLAGQTASTTACSCEEGCWMVRLPALPAGGPYELTISGSNTIKVQDVLIGEVWLASGQSNMAMTLSGCFEAEKHIAASTDGQLRLLTVPRKSAIEPLEQADLKWAASDPTTTPSFSAVAYWFGAKLRRDLGVPVGLINTSYGGTPAEAWTDYGTLFLDPKLRPLTANFEKTLMDWPARIKQFNDVALPKWKDDVAAAKAAGKPAPRQPGQPMGPTHQSRPAGLFNGMVAPLLPYAVAGAIWYQGEANASRAAEYKTLFPTMIRNWREEFGQGDFPFLFVQLAPYMKIVDQPQESGWAELREAQLHTLRNVPNTGMAVITDVGEEADIHPKKKLPVGERLALAALRLQYGWKNEWLGPLYRGIRIEGSAIRVEFEHARSGLRTDGQPLTGFTIAGADRVWHKATAQIVGREVCVSSPAVREPVAVRYGWADFPVVNLWNKAGLPATPFRTDNWPRPKAP
ncbi:MAG: hypothetical protein IT204_15935 [Fimbriimonadaceae bacterium]|nr:hypothetical protein [Fimbriimonadaceae bacterium]